jgi:hypothetical protein
MRDAATAGISRVAARAEWQALCDEPLVLLRPGSGSRALVTVPLVSPVVRREIVALTRVADQLTPGCAGFISHFKLVTGKA